jgi:hypothetical protein
MKEKMKCRCPFCQEEIFYDKLICQTCRIEFIVCPCGQLVNKKKDYCPKCGRKIEKGEEK